jgi:hypothetical protein
MRRQTRRALTPLGLFLVALFVILYITGGGQSSQQTYDWISIRYKNTSTALPRPRGRCPGLEDTTKPALVVARVSADGDQKWSNSLSKKYHLCVYTADAPLDEDSTTLQVPANRGHEAMAYLTYLIDNYDVLPAASVFVHGSRWAWHNDSPDYDNVKLLHALNVSSALAPAGYHNLRCDWSAGTCPASAAQQGSLETTINARLDPWNARAVSDAALPPALVNIFGGPMTKSSATASKQRVGLGHADTVKAQCCAQFVVARENIQQHSRAEYTALRQWLLDSGPGSAPKDDRTAGRILSYLWHILFLPQQDYSPRASPGSYGGVRLDRINSLACPSAAECYCRLYGRCNLVGCVAPDACLGQYEIPPDYKLPADWEASHGDERGDGKGSVQGHDDLRRRYDHLGT